MSDYFPERNHTQNPGEVTRQVPNQKSLIKSSAFIQSHLRTTILSDDQNDSHLVLLSAHTYNSIEDTLNFHQHHWLHWDTPDFNEHSTLPTPVIFMKRKKPGFNLSEEDRISNVVGTCNGLVCLETGLFDRSPTFIWNPSIRKVVKLPKPPVCFKYTEYDKLTLHGFGYDAHSNDYKIFRIVSLPEDHSDLSRFATAVQVYSLARGSWKRLSKSAIPIDLHCGFEHHSTFVNGTFHMLQSRLSTYYNDRYEEHQKCGGELFICTFNLAIEEFGEIPAAVQESGCTITRYEDSLAMIKHHDYSKRDLVNRGCDIWVMKQYGVAESWTYMFKVSVAQASIFGFKRCGEVVLEDHNEYGGRIIVSFDPKTKQFTVEGGIGEGYEYNFMDSFVESLVLLDHANAISYQLTE